MAAIVELRTGKLLFTIQGDKEAIALNTPSGAIAVEEPPRSNMYYDKGWIDMPQSPSINHIFDYNSKVWVDPRNLYEIKAQKWDEIKSVRDKLEFGGFEYKGNVYDSDQVSQGRIMGAAIAGVDQAWTLANNTTVTLTGDELKELYAALQMHVAALHERGRIARYNIDVAMTPQEIEAVTL